MPVPEFDSENPMDGTKYTKGVFKDGIYTNECAELKIKVPDGYESIGDEDLDEMFMYAVNQTPAGADKNLLLATKEDAGFWLKGETIYVSFLNTWLGSKAGRDYTEEDYLNDYLKYISKGLEKDGITAAQSDIVKVTLKGRLLREIVHGVMTKGVILMEELPGLAAPFFTLSKKVLYRTLT